MGEDPILIRTVSLHLSRVLDEAGLNKLAVRRRRRTFLFSEQLDNVYYRLTEKEITVYHFGSQTEGATTPGLDSDLDELLCYHGYNVIENWSDWQQGKLNLLMLQDMTAPVYCRLRLLRYEEPVAVEEVPNDKFTYDSDGRVVMTNTMLNTILTGTQRIRNGPALSEPGNYAHIDKDIVAALHCKFWPAQAEEFISRRRRHGWPSQNLLQEAVKHRVFVVPVGYKLSPTEHLEWRISASLTERCLMFSLGTVHIKCYVVLKMLVKTFIEPRASKCISSYHCKTAILYSVENTVSAAFWREDNLLQCVTQCLTLLHTWVKDGHCPHFVIAEENLFAGKVTPQNRNLLQSILKDLITRNVRALIHVHTDALGHLLQGKLSTEPSVVPVLDSWATIGLMVDIELNRHMEINHKMKEIMIKDKNTQLVPIIRSVYRNIVILKGRIRHLEKHERQATAVLIENLSHWFGSLLASFSLSREMRVPRMAIELLRIGDGVASMLKLASVFYSNGDCRKVESILCEVENHVSRNTMTPVCRCYAKPVLCTHEFAQNLFLQRGSRARSKLFCLCVRFSPQEIHCTPPAIRNEFFRSVGDDFQHGDPRQDDWMDLAAVDCLPFMYYLLFMTYRQLGKRDLQRQSLHNLDRCLREDHNFCHLETGWNLLGHCKELELEPKAAMTCYRTSLEIKPKNNAAKWHIAVLCYKVIKPHL